MFSILLVDFNVIYLLTCFKQQVAQGGGTPMYSVLRSSSSVKMKVNGQAPKKAGGQKSNCLLADQESTWHFTKNMDIILHNRIISVLYITNYSILALTRPYTICDIVIEHN